MLRFSLDAKAYAVLVILAAACAFAFAPTIDAPAVIREFERMAEHPPWPNFTPNRTPVAVFDGAKTWLFRHPTPPPEFMPVAGDAGLRVADGRYAGMTANTSSIIGGVMTATYLNSGATSTVRPA